MYAQNSGRSCLLENQLLDEDLNFWERRYQRNPSYRNWFPFERVVTTIFQLRRKLNRPLRLLELGCGCGNNLRLLYPQLVERAVGIDISETAIAFATENCDVDQVEFRCHDILSFPYPLEEDYAVDLVIDRSTLSLLKKEDVYDILDYLKSRQTAPFYFLFNPYSDIHTSRPASGQPLSTTPNAGSLTADAVTFYSRNDTLETMAEFEIVNIELVSATNFTGEFPIIDAEWSVLGYYSKKG